MDETMVDSISIILELIRLFFVAMMPFAMLFLVIAVISAVFYSWSEGISFSAAFGTVTRKMIGFFFEKEEPIYYPDGLLLNALLKALEPYNKLPIEWVAVIYGTYPNTKIPCIRLVLITDIFEEVWDIIKEILEQVMREEMRKRNLFLLRLKIFWEQAEEGKYYIFVLYAITPKQAEEFDKYNEKLRKYKEQKAIEETKRTIDEELEQDLKETENKNGN